MKNTILCGALLTLISVQASADNTVKPDSQGAAATATTAPAAEGHAAETTEASSSAPAVINCDYKIDPSNKSVDASVVLSWAEKATVQAFDFDSTKLDSQMESLKNCFTEQGWSGFNSAIQSSGNLDAIKNQHLTVSSQIDGQANMDDSKDNHWKMTMPLQVVYQNDKEKITQLLDIKLTVSRKITGDLGITQMIATPRVASNKPSTAPSAVGEAKASTEKVATPTETTTQPTTSAPDSTPTVPSEATAPTVGDSSAEPTSGTPTTAAQPAPTAPQ